MNVNKLAAAGSYLRACVELADIDEADRTARAEAADEKTEAEERAADALYHQRWLEKHCTITYDDDGNATYTAKT